VHANTGATGRLAPNGYFVRITCCLLVIWIAEIFGKWADETRTSECGNILLHPMKCKTLIAQTNISMTGLCDLLASKEAPGREAVINGNTDDWLPNLNGVLDDKREIVTLVNTTTFVEATTVDPKTNWELLILET
jgi:hypothetical protein